MEMSEREPEHLIVVDIGNHQVKLARLPKAEIPAIADDLPVLRLRSQLDSFETLTDWLPSGRATWCVASVSRPVEARLAQWVASQRPADDYLRLANDMLPIEIRVEQPERVGTDRLVAALAAAALRTDAQAVIVIDAGSAITVDLVSADGAFEGGAILPGFEMMAAALAQQTDQLPLIEPSDSTQPPPVVGKSTVQAIRSGLFWSHIGAVRELVGRISSELEVPPEIFVAGGDAEIIAKFLNASVRVVPNLVFQGILIAYCRRPRTSPVFAQLKQRLIEANVPYEVLRHEPVYTSEDAARIRGVPLASGAKALVCKADDQFLMFVLPADRRLANRQIRSLYGFRKLRFASPQEVLEITGLEPGSIPPFGSLFGLPTWCDERLADQQRINFNAGDHSISISMTYADYLLVEQPKIATVAEPR